MGNTRSLNGLRVHSTPRNAVLEVELYGLTTVLIDPAPDQVAQTYDVIDSWMRWGEKNSLEHAIVDLVTRRPSSDLQNYMIRWVFNVATIVPVHECHPKPVTSYQLLKLMELHRASNEIRSQLVTLIGDTEKALRQQERLSGRYITAILALEQLEEEETQ